MKPLELIFLGTELYLGEIAPLGVYVYVLKYKFNNDDMKTKTGNVNLIK